MIPQDLVCIAIYSRNLLQEEIFANHMTCVYTYMCYLLNQLLLLRHTEKKHSVALFLPSLCFWVHPWGNQAAEQLPQTQPSAQTYNHTRDTQNMQANRLQAIHYMYSLYTCVQVILHTFYICTCIHYTSNHCWWMYSVTGRVWSHAVSSAGKEWYLCMRSYYVQYTRLLSI